MIPLELLPEIRIILYTTMSTIHVKIQHFYDGVRLMWSRIKLGFMRRNEMVILVVLSCCGMAACSKDQFSRY